jgi:hypothetical protein
MTEPNSRVVSGERRGEDSLFDHGARGGTKHLMPLSGDTGGAPRSRVSLERGGDPLEGRWALERGGNLLDGRWTLERWRFVRGVPDP